MDILLPHMDYWPPIANDAAASGERSNASVAQEQDLGLQSNSTIAEETFEHLYTSSFKSLYAYGMHLCQDGGIVEDCIQDLFADLWNRPDLLTTIHAIRPYLFTSFRRAVLKKLALQRKQVLGDDWEKQGFEITLPHESFLIQSQISEAQRQQLEQALQQLSKKQREVLYLKFNDGMSPVEIAELMGISTMAVYKLISRSLDQLKELLPGFYLLLLYPSFLEPSFFRIS